MTMADTSTAQIDEEPAVDAPSGEESEAFVRLVERLSRQSVDKHYDAYADIPWDDPAYAIDPEDPRWELGELDALFNTEWYQSQTPEVRARIGLYRVASAMKIGLQFENVLKRGLLEYAMGLDNRDPTFRYAYHEVIEEAHHGLMFQEFVNRTPFELPGFPWDIRFGSNRVVMLGRHFPPLFFMFVLGGEDPIDYEQRKELRSPRDIHPLLETIIRHHVTEEARHLSFARNYLKREVPKLGWPQRQILAVATPVILGTMVQLMLQAPDDLVKTFAIPDEVVREAYRSSDHARSVAASLHKVRRLSREIGIINPVSTFLWKRFGIWGDDDSTGDQASA
jgi:hypothetical protein